MKKVLVTGGDGFIGSHLVESLVEQGIDVRAMSLYNSFNTWGWLDSSKYVNDIEVICGDVRDPFFCNKAVEGVDTVFHLAALIAIPYSYVAPDSYVGTNIQGTLNMCQAALSKGVDRIIHTSTSEVYGSAQFVPITEEHPLQPQSPYSASKIGADAMAMSYFNSFDLPLTIARPFNTYGPRQSARAVIPTIISQIADGAEQIKIGDVRPTRDFNYVKDTCEGFITLAKSKDSIGKTINIGAGKEISIGDLFNKIKELMNSNVEFVVDEERIRPEKSEVMRLCCDSSKIKELGYEQKYGLTKGLQETIDWFSDKNNLSKYKTGIYNV